MKRALLLLTVLGLAFCPLLISQAQAAPVKHHTAARQHKKHLQKKTARRITRRHHRKIAV
jgi:hypothetical protein